jgi:hypothetical protein
LCSSRSEVSIYDEARLVPRPCELSWRILTTRAIWKLQALRGCSLFVLNQTAGMSSPPPHDVMTSLGNNTASVCSHRSTVSHHALQHAFLAALGLRLRLLANAVVFSCLTVSFHLWEVVRSSWSCRLAIRSMNFMCLRLYCGLVSAHLQRSCNDLRRFLWYSGRRH